MIPIYKKEDRTEINRNNKFRVISSNQFGFREGISTHDEILKFTKKNYKSIDRSIVYFHGIFKRSLHLKILV